MAEDGEDDEACEEARHAVADGHDQRVAVDVVVVLVVGSKRHQATEADTETEEDLSGCVRPHLRLRQVLPVRLDVELNALVSTFQRHAAEEEDHEDDVGKRSREVDNLKRG